jgi:Ca2+-binding EF-hand superfamily protein
MAQTDSLFNSEDVNKISDLNATKEELEKRKKEEKEKAKRKKIGMSFSDKEAKKDRINEYIKEKKAQREKERQEAFSAYLDEKIKKEHQQKAELLQRPQLKEAMNALSIQIEEMKDGFFAVFEAFDLDKNGTLSKTELKEGCAQLGVKLSPLELTGLMDSFDSDRGGDIDFSEFCGIMKEYMEANPAPVRSAQEIAADRMCGFHVGDRVHCNVTTKPPDETRQTFELGSVMGPGVGKGKGFIRIKLDSGTEYNVRPNRNHLALAKGE